MPGDLLGGIKFVKLTAVADLPVAEAIQKLLRRRGVAAVIINDERFQARPESERAEAAPPPEGFRIEVPEKALEKAREALAELRRSEEP
jgi:hypothetical protein